MLLTFWIYMTFIKEALPKTFDVTESSIIELNWQWTLRIKLRDLSWYNKLHFWLVGMYCKRIHTFYLASIYSILLVITKTSLPSSLTVQLNCNHKCVSKETVTWGIMYILRMNEALQGVLWVDERRTKCITVTTDTSSTPDSCLILFKEIKTCLKCEW